MAAQYLVAYATVTGFTAGVAEAIGKSLREKGFDVDVKRAKDVADVSGYDACIAGTGVRAGRVFGETVRFLQRFQATLQTKPVAYFVVCLTMKDDTAENRSAASAYLDQLKEKVPGIKPVDEGLFAGGVDFAKLGFPFKQILKAMKSPEGDFRDWDAIHTWAGEVADKLSA